MYIFSNKYIFSRFCIQNSEHENKYFIKMNPYEDFSERTGRARISTSNTTKKTNTCREVVENIFKDYDLLDSIL